MFKKIFTVLLIIFLQSFSLSAYAKTVKVIALNSFDSQNPPKYFKVKLLEPFYIEQDNLTLEENFILDGYIDSVIPPKRLKQDATFVYVPTKYLDNNNQPHKISDIIGTHSTKINTTGVVHYIHESQHVYFNAFRNQNNSFKFCRNLITTVKAFYMFKNPMGFHYGEFLLNNYIKRGPCNFLFNTTEVRALNKTKNFN